MHSVGRRCGASWAMNGRVPIARRSERRAGSATRDVSLSSLLRRRFGSCAGLDWPRGVPVMAPLFACCCLPAAEPCEARRRVKLGSRRATVELHTRLAHTRLAAQLLGALAARLRLLLAAHRRRQAPGATTACSAGVPCPAALRSQHCHPLDRPPRTHPTPGCGLPPACASAASATCLPPPPAAPTGAVQALWPRGSVHHAGQRIHLGRQGRTYTARCQRWACQPLGRPAPRCEHPAREAGQPAAGQRSATAGSAALPLLRQQQLRWPQSELDDPASCAQRGGSLPNCPWRLHARSNPWCRACAPTAARRMPWLAPLQPAWGRYISTIRKRAQLLRRCPVGCGTLVKARGARQKPPTAPPLARIHKLPPAHDPAAGMLGRPGQHPQIGVCLVPREHSAARDARARGHEARCAPRWRKSASRARRTPRVDFAFHAMQAVEHARSIRAASRAGNAQWQWKLRFQVGGSGRLPERPPLREQRLAHAVAAGLAP
jgi:hypothetical protein